MKTASISRIVARKIERGGAGRLWTYSDFTPHSESAVAAALSRLKKKGVVKRVRKGVYYLPKPSRFGDAGPDPTRVAEAVLRHRGVPAVSSGLPAYNALGLTTQVSPVAVFDVENKTSSLRTGTTFGRIRLRPVKRVRGLRTEERAILDSLRDIRDIPDATPDEVIHKITKLLSSGDVDYRRIASAAKREPPRVRALVGLLGTLLGEDRNLLNELRGTLNNTTRFKIGLLKAIPEARDWGIQ
jgi:hypothetical protein